MFWSGETIKKRLSEIISIEGGSTPHLESQIDGSSFTLRIGPEVFVTSKDPKDGPNNTKLILEKNGPFIIPAGQFALMLTEEIITIPPDVMGFISFKAKFKFKGLVNVS